jgi:hypothetical protein
LDHWHSLADHPDRLAAGRIELTARSRKAAVAGGLFAGTTFSQRPFFFEKRSKTMTHDPNRLDERSDRPIGYGAGRHSSGMYTAMVLGALIALVAIFYLIGQVGGNRTENANNPSETKATVGQSTPERTETPAQSPTTPRQ